MGGGQVEIEGFKPSLETPSTGDCGDFIAGRMLDQCLIEDSGG